MIEELLKSLENIKNMALSELNSGEITSKESQLHLKGMVAGIEVAIKTAKYEVEMNEQ